VLSPPLIRANVAHNTLPLLNAGAVELQPAG